MAEGGAQQALAGLADDAGAAEPIRLAAYAAATRSVRLFGNKLTGKQASAVVDVVSGTGSVKIRNAAAQLLGALNLPSEKIKELIR
jgi:major membrane immunogen (membrane-anchored lipoprotein)